MLDLQWFVVICGFQADLVRELWLRELAPETFVPSNICFLNVRSRELFHVGTLDSNFVITIKWMVLNFGFIYKSYDLLTDIHVSVINSDFHPFGVDKWVVSWLSDVCPSLRWRRLVNAHEVKAGVTWLDCYQLSAVCIWLLSPVLNLVVVAVLCDRLLWGWALCLNHNKEDYYYCLCCLLNSVFWGNARTIFPT